MMFRFDDAVRQCLRAQEPAGFARYLFVLAQKFNHFYHEFPVMHEPDAGRRSARAALTWLFKQTMLRGCSLLGLPVPHRM
jgi:arginyl-tRNA synthetase